jgi:hypothetical protein
MKTSKKDTLTTLNTRTGAKKTSYSSYWMDFDDTFFDVDTRATGATDTEPSADAMTTERIMRLSAVRRSIANFVRILTNDDTVRVKFSSGNQSYTDGKTVVIAAEDDPEKFDVMVGLALHEGAHCLLSDFGFLQNALSSDHARWIQTYQILKKELRETMPVTEDQFELRNPIRAYQKMLGMLMNIIEDRRIDSFVYKNASGYRPYYDAMYTKYFFNKDVEKNMMGNPDWRVASVENYMNWLINIFSPKFDRNALPGLSAMVDAIDLANIRRFDEPRMPVNFERWDDMNGRGGRAEDSFATVWPELYNSMSSNKYFKDYSTMPLLWRTANDILHMILQYVAKSEVDKMGEAGKQGDPIEIDMDGVMIQLSPDGLENLDMGGVSVVVNTKYNPARGKSSMEKIKKALSGKTTKRKLRNKQEQDEIDHLESASASIAEVGDKIVGKFPCLVTRKLNKSIMLSDWFPFARKTWNNADRPAELSADPESLNSVAKGVRMGQVLVHRLQVRNDPVVTHFTRQDSGNIDRRLLAQLGMNIEQVFKRTTVENYKPVLLHLSLDASGSMSGEKWDRVLSVATALAYVASKIQSIEVVITIRGDTHDMPIVSVVYDSRVDNFQKVRSLFPALTTRGSTPEGLCFQATLDLITENAHTYDLYFINFSDGEPGTSVRKKNLWNSYGGDTAYEHTRRQVQTLREAGVKVLSYFIGYESSSGYGNQTYGKKAFRKMYGEDSVFVNVSSVTDVLRTLNKLLLKKE